MPLLIGSIYAFGTSESSEGFIETAKIYQHLQGVGFTAEQVDKVLVESNRKKLIENNVRLIPEIGQTMPNRLRVTTLGLYHITRLCSQFAYIDAIIVDTPILDSDIRALISDVSYIDQRLERAEYFQEYLDAQWSNMNICDLGFNWEIMSSTLKKQIENIRGRRIDFS